MASTSTNKQPLLVDRVLHYVVDLNSAINNGIDIIGTNTAVMLVNAVQSDGAIIEDIYSIARDDKQADINLYMSTASDYLRPLEAQFIGTFKSGTAAGEVTSWTLMPKILAPVPHVADVPTGTAAYDTLGEEPSTVAPVAATGNPVQLRALYIPKGRTLWAARNSNENLTSGPLLGCQGGWY